MSGAGTRTGVGTGVGVGVGVGVGAGVGGAVGLGVDVGRAVARTGGLPAPATCEGSVVEEAVAPPPAIEHADQESAADGDDREAARRGRASLVLGVLGVHVVLVAA